MTADVLLCCGVGGAGKTTTAAGLAVTAALAGRRVVVLTIDPARRLADAIGVERLGNTPHRIELPGALGTLDALMLDRKATWDELVRREAPNPEIAERLLDNPYYRALSTRLTGGHEYMATEKLHELATSGRWDLVVVDTPPAQHAVDFFRAPDRIRRLLDPRLLGAIFRPSGIVGAATRSVVGVIRRLAGDKVIGELDEFFRLVSGLSEGLRERGAAVHAMLGDPRCRYLLVTNALAPREEELVAFLDVLRADGRRFAGFVLNRVTEPPGPSPEALLAAIPPAPEGVDPARWATVDRALREAVVRSFRVAARHEALAARLAVVGDDAPVWRVPEFDGGVEDVAGLIALASHLPTF